MIRIRLGSLSLLYGAHTALDDSIAIVARRKAAYLSRTSNFEKS